MGTPFPLTEIEPGLWSNGHLRFDPVQRQSLAWEIRLADNPKNSEPVAYIRWNGIFREYVLLTKAVYIFGWDCLEDISHFIDDRNAVRCR